MKRIEIKGNTVTPKEVENAILEVAYSKLGKKMTIAHITTIDGFEVTGTAGCVDPEKFDYEIGKKIAFENAKDRVWQHMGSILQDRLLTK